MKKFRRDLDEKNSQLAAIQNELDVTLKEMDILKEENNQLTDQLRSTRDEVQNIGLEFQNFRQNAENERNARIEQKETTLQEHYQKSLAFQIQKVQPLKQGSNYHKPLKYFEIFI